MPVIKKISQQTALILKPSWMVPDYLSQFRVSWNHKCVVSCIGGLVGAAVLSSPPSAVNALWPPFWSLFQGSLCGNSILVCVEEAKLRTTSPVAWTLQEKSCCWFMHGRLFDEISISVFLFNQEAHKDGAERSQTAVLKPDVQDFTTRWMFPASHVSVAEARSKWQPQKVVVGSLCWCVGASAPPLVEDWKSSLLVNWQSAPTICCSLLPRCCLPQKRGESVCVYIYFILFFPRSPRAFALTKPLLWAPTAHRVTFSPASRPMAGIFRMQNAAQSPILCRARSPCSRSHIWRRACVETT